MAKCHATKLILTGTSNRTQLLACAGRDPYDIGLAVNSDSFGSFSADKQVAHVAELADALDSGKISRLFHGVFHGFFQSDFPPANIAPKWILPSRAEVIWKILEVAQKLAHDF